MQTKPPSNVKFVPWAKLGPSFLRNWEQGEHVAIIGPTGRGKTTAAIQLLESRAEKRGGSVLLLATKRRDPSLLKLGWPIIRDWPPDYEHRVGKRIIVWPKYGAASTVGKRNKKVFVNLLDKVTDEGSWTVYFDEAIYFTESLGMRRNLDELWNTARSNKVTVVASSQGVSWVPRAMMTQQTWVFCFKPTDLEVAKRTAEITGDKERFFPVLRSLKPHDFLVVHTLTGNAYVSRIELKKGK